VIYVEDLVDLREEAPQSLEDRLAERLRPDLKDDAETPQQEAQEAPEEEVDDEPAEPIEELEATVEGAEAVEEVVEIEIEGEVLEVPERYKDYFLRQKDYTQKTQTLAEQRKEVELQQKTLLARQKEQEFLQEAQPDINNIGYLDAQIKQMSEDLRKDVNNLPSDELFKKKIEVDGLKEQRQALADGLQVKYKEFEDAQEQTRKELLEQGAQVLKQKIPDWNADKQKAVSDYALSKGMSQEVVASLIDPVHVEILWEASQFQALKQGVKGAKTKVKSAPVIQPKARSPKQTENDKKLAVRNKLRSDKLDHREKAVIIQEELGERFG
jgi:hypothetical protein